jgi:hypothetical protein
MRWQVQLGINRYEWMSYNFGKNFQTSQVLLIPNCTSKSHDYLFIISMTKFYTSQCQHHILSPKPSHARLSTKIWCFCSYSTINEIIVLLSTNQHPVICHANNKTSKKKYWGTLGCIAAQWVIKRVYRQLWGWPGYHNCKTISAVGPGL